MFVQGLPGPDVASRRCTRRLYNNGIGSSRALRSIHLEPCNPRTTSDPDHLALRWANVDLDSANPHVRIEKTVTLSARTAALRIEQKTKNRKSKRPITIDPVTAAELSSLRTRQRQ